jgi:hypothetical protein
MTVVAGRRVWEFGVVIGLKLPELQEAVDVSRQI